MYTGLGIALAWLIWVILSHFLYRCSKCHSGDTEISYYSENQQDLCHYQIKHCKKCGHTKSTEWFFIFCIGK